MKYDLSIFIFNSGSGHILINDSKYDFRQFYQMWIIRITLLKLQVLKLSELGWKYLRNYWGRLWQKCDKYITTIYVTIYVTEVSHIKCWWVGGGSNPGPPD